MEDITFGFLAQFRKLMEGPVERSRPALGRGKRIIHFGAEFKSGARKLGHRDMFYFNIPHRVLVELHDMMPSEY